MDPKQARYRNDVGNILVCQRLRSLFPIICSPLQNQAVNFAASTYQHLSGLLLADSISADENENNVEVDVLSGAHYYWHFLTGAIKLGESGPTALQTKVGWAISGPVQGGSPFNKLDASQFHEYSRTTCGHS